jgi:signal transduction histidine kinase
VGDWIYVGELAMKIGRLYIKIFFSFLLILFVTELFILGLFGILVRRNTNRRIGSYIEAHTMVLRELVEEKTGAVFPAGEKGSSLNEILTELGDLYRAHIWVAASDGELLYKSFQGAPPDVSMEKRRRMLFPNHRRQEPGGRTPSPFFITVPVQIGEGEPGTLNVLLHRFERNVLVRPFFLGLIFIGGIIALLLYPVSRIITRPLEELRRSVQMIAEGDLKRRAVVRSNDEIGDLVRSFNMMSETIERVVSGTRELTAHISHELRSPLARIRMTEELLRKKIAKAKHDEIPAHLDGIHREIEEMDHLIGQVLKLSKLDLEMASAEKEKVDLTCLIEDLITRFSPAMKKKALNVDLKIPETPLEVRGDREDLGTAFSNLLDNAVKFTPSKGEISISIKSIQDCVAFSCENSVQSAEHTDREKMFEPFYRGVRDEASGTGLGLAIVKKVVENHRGVIRAEKTGRRMKMHVCFPLFDQPPA